MKRILFIDGEDESVSRFMDKVEKLIEKDPLSDDFEYTFMEEE